MPISLVAGLVFLGLGLVSALRWWQSAAILWMLAALVFGLASAFLLRQHFDKP
jgi:hypothetical protein